jgi:hypothetical protein
MNEQDHLKTLSDIKTLMERSSRFLSLSGLSGVFIGCYALAGAAAAWHYLGSNGFESITYYSLATDPGGEIAGPLLGFLIGDALLVMMLSLVTAYVLTQRLAKKQGLQIWDTSAKRMLVNLLIPLVTGGIFCLVLLHHHGIGLVAPSMLIFYGLALLNAGKYTYNDIRFLGMAEIAVGLFAAVYPGLGLLCWAVGFGIIHMVYGIAMYYKYER